MRKPLVLCILTLNIFRAGVVRACYVFPPEQRNPCKDKQCSFGARCVPSPDGHTATCRCPTSCPNYGDHAGSRPVCGSDGVDYKDHCELRKEACMRNLNITVKFPGKCDPCSSVTCSEPEICQLNDQRLPVCRCGDTCPLEFMPVCGSDGKTYSNECSLRQEACRTRKVLNIIYRGKCSSGINPCTSVRCTLGEQCVINKFGIARCECPPKCEPIVRPVCSIDGRTYSSECELQRSGCISRVPIAIAYTGACGMGRKSGKDGMGLTGVCNNHQCPMSAICVEKDGKASCECPPLCSAEFRPVCGSDGITYGNECKLRREACVHRREIRVLYHSSCNGCESKKCDFYAICESDGSAEGQCVCPQACKDDKYVNGTICGSDGKSYANECELRVSSCRTKQEITPLYKGDCDLCLGIECKYGARCEAGDCACPTNCQLSGVETVCGSNMITYPNECELRKASCLQKTYHHQPITIIFYGECRERFPSVPGHSSTNPPSLGPVHANNININTNLIHSTSNQVSSHGMEREACRDIHCDFEATCELGPDNFPRCTCQFDCSNPALILNAKPVCASDLRIYPSLCAMKMEACQRQEELRLRPLDLCQGMEVKPCNGDKPLVDPLTGKELDCGNGPLRKDCPSGSYCHQTARLARCCLKEQVSMKKSCDDSWFGCCPDGKSPAKGPENLGCPAMCGCNKLGAYSEVCDPITKGCKCRPGVGGEKCDRCEPGYWGLPKISSGHHGCIPCGCSTFGSVREDCEQMTGRCVCKPEIQGQKCTVCTGHDKILSPNGCVSADLSTPPPSSCKELMCHFGAVCVERGRYVTCECRAVCPEEPDAQVVCGSDGQTYPSACQLRQIACKFQKDIVVQAFGTCKKDQAITVKPPRRFTSSDDSNLVISKYARHAVIKET